MKKKTAHNPYATMSAGKIEAQNKPASEPKGSKIEGGGDLRARRGR